MIKAVIFDMDGVLIDSVRLHYETWKETLAQYGVDFTWEDFGRWNGISATKTVELMNKHFGLSLDPIQTTKHKESLYLAKIKSNTLLFSDVIETLDYLKNKRYILGLATSADRMVFDVVSDQFAKYFDAVTTADDVTHSKPHPEIYLATAMKLGVDVVNCVVIEDANTGIAAAKAAGMYCLGITTTHNSNELVSADQIVHSLTEAKKTIEELQ